MIDIVLSLVFTMPLLVIMIYPAMKISDALSNKFYISPKLDDKLTIIITIVLALIFGILLRFT